MFELKFNKNKITPQELNEIEKSFKRYLREKITPEFNVLNFSRTDVYAHILNIFVRLNIHQHLNINISQMLDFLIDVAEKYTEEAPYHTIYHAADIVTVLYYLCHDLNADKYLTNLDITFLMVSALCHDTGHPGFNNAFQSKLKSELIKKYGETSVLEIYSIDLTIQLFKKHDITITTTTKDKDIIRDLILSTDMAFHNELVQQSKDLFTKENTWNKQQRLSLCRILLHAADISNMARPWEISKQWSDLIVKEFFHQGDEERKRNMPISPGMDRNTCSQKNISLKFSQVILPYFQSIADLLPKSCIFVDYLLSNRLQWETIDQPIVNKTTNNTKKRDIRRVSSDIHLPLSTIKQQNQQTIKYKRIRLGFRSQSYPTVLYHHHTHRNHHYHHNLNVVSVEKSHNNLLLLPLVTFKSTTSLYDKPNNIETIVLYHPYDK